VLEAAQLAGKDVVLLDADYPRFGFRLEDMERIRREPGIVVVTHQFGYPEDVAEIKRRLGSDYFVIEDCAGAMFSRVGGHLVGTLGDAAIFSFETSKLWTLGRGGLVATRDSTIAATIKKTERATSTRGAGALLHLLLRRILTAQSCYRFLLPLYLLTREPTEGMHVLSRALTPEYNRGFTAGQAALGQILAARISVIVQHRQALFSYYERALADVPGIARIPAIKSAVVTPIRYPILVERGDKRLLYNRVRSDGIDLGFSYSYHLGDENRHPGAARIAARILNIPLYSDVTLRQAERIVASVRRHASVAN
jgi:dTDP-4-amino-4,6-dideoxygalactose transaminase